MMKYSFDVCFMWMRKVYESVVEGMWSSGGGIKWHGGVSRPSFRRSVTPCIKLLLDCKVSFVQRGRPRYRQAGWLKRTDVFESHNKTHLAWCTAHRPQLCTVLFRTDQIDKCMGLRWAPTSDTADKLNPHSHTICPAAQVSREYWGVNHQKARSINNTFRGSYIRATHFKATRELIQCRLRAMTHRRPKRKQTYIMPNELISFFFSLLFFLHSAHFCGDAGWAVRWHGGRPGRCVCVCFVVFFRSNRPSPASRRAR